jgi:hypothetical protein
MRYKKEKYGKNKTLFSVELPELGHQFNYVIKDQGVHGFEDFLNRGLESPY